MPGRVHSRAYRSYGAYAPSASTTLTSASVPKNATDQCRTKMTATAARTSGTIPTYSTTSQACHSDQEPPSGVRKKNGKSRVRKFVGGNEYSIASRYDHSWARHDSWLSS
jgi:hypothetical protein